MKELPRGKIINYMEILKEKYEWDIKNLQTKILHLKRKAEVLLELIKVIEKKENPISPKTPSDGHSR